MISLKKLDTKNFSRIMEDSRKEIHRYGESWTDENYHDPGITILEMLSWLTEMQRFYIDNVSEQSELELLKILGVDGSVKLSYGTVEFHNNSADQYIPKGTKLIAEEQIFETNRELFVINNRIDSVFTVDDSVKDISRYIDIEDTYFNLFNNNNVSALSEIKAGNSLILLLNKPLKRDVLLSIRFDIKDDYKIKLSKDCSEKLGLSYTMHHKVELDDREGYKEFIETPANVVEIIEDETLGFKKSGCIYFKLKSEHEKMTIKSKTGYPLVFTVDNYYNLLEPQIKNISLNNMSVSNKNTVCDYKVIEGSSGILYEEIYKLGYVYAEIENDDGSWSSYDQFDIDTRSYPYEVQFHDEAKFRVLAYDDKQISSEVIGFGTSTPYQKVRFYMEKVLLDNIVLSSSREINNKENWFNYIYKSNLLSAAPDENVFTYDFHEQELIFGNDEFGSLLEEGIENIKVIKMIKSDYVRGNLKKATLRSFFNKGIYKGINFENIDDCTSGENPPDMQLLKKKFVNKINASKTIVTTKDYEKSIKDFKYTRILFSKSMASTNVENTVDVYAVPFTNTRFYKMNEEFRTVLTEYMEKYKLISTNIIVKEPEYIEIKIELKLSIKNRNTFDIEKIRSRLKTLYNPTEVNNVNYDYVMGTMPSKIELIKVIKNKYKNVVIEKVALSAIGKGVMKNSEGYTLPDNAVIYCDEVNINLV